MATKTRSNGLIWASLTKAAKITNGGLPKSEPGDIALLKELIEAGELKTVIDIIYPLDEIVMAHRYVQGGRKKGNVIIVVGGSEGA